MICWNVWLSENVSYGLSENVSYGLSDNISGCFFSYYYSSGIE